jgi:acyl-CoA reductase-like NAD-dependent aldehyde dehydrogenase
MPQAGITLHIYLKHERFAAFNLPGMACVFMQDINRALRVASEFDAGMVGINCVSLNFKNVPFGGTKESGLG